jgi:sugar phosphate isomerase/epimerase
MTMFPSACIWSYETSIEEALKQIKNTAFHYVDIEPDTLDKNGALQVLKDLGLKVSCVAMDHNLPSGCSLDAKNRDALQKAVTHLKDVLHKCQTLEARVAYVGPCADARQLQAFGSALKELADDAAQKGIKLCVEHVPRRSLPTAKEALKFLNRLDHANLYLLLDVGHTLLSGEKPWAAAEAAGDRLGYVQMNDNDGKKDRHWPLLDGVLTYEGVSKTIDALRQIGYEGTLGLELTKDIPSLISGFSRNRNLLLRIQDLEGHISFSEPETRRK